MNYSRIRVVADYEKKINTSLKNNREFLSTTDKMIGLEFLGQLFGGLLFDKKNPISVRPNF